MVARMKGAMRRMARSVTIVTARFQGERMAMSATGVDSLSLEPPSLLVCINRSASIYPAFAAGAPFCVNILGRTHRPLAEACGGRLKGEARFSTGAWAEGDNGAPYLEDAQAAVFCEPDGQFQYGSHGVFVGRVIDVRLFGEPTPLIYFDAGYWGAGGEARGG